MFLNFHNEIFKKKLRIFFLIQMTFVYIDGLHGNNDLLRSPAGDDFSQNFFFFLSRPFHDHRS